MRAMPGADPSLAILFLLVLITLSLAGRPSLPATKE